MNPEYQPYELIDLYLQGGLNDAERAAFEQRLWTDSAFKNLYESQALAYTLVEQHEFLQFKKEFKQELNLFEKKHTSKPFHKGWWALLIVGSLAASSYYFYKKTGEITTAEKLFPISESNNTPAIPQQKQRINVPAETLVHQEAATKPAASILILESNDSVVVSNVNENIPALEKKESETIENIVPKTVVDLCKEVRMSAETTVSGTCFNKQDGRIEISEVTGGNPPYLFSIQGIGHFVAQHNFESLKTGRYTITIKDVQGCVSTLKNTVEVPLLDCTIRNDHTFSMNYESEWKYPIKPGSSAVFKLINNSGSIVHNETIREGIPDALNIFSIRNGNIEAGYYIFTIDYTDGSSEKGSLTIIQ